MDALTILCFWLDDDVPFNQQILQSGTARHVKLTQRKSADSRRPETLEGLRVLAPRLDQDIEGTPALRSCRFEHTQHCIRLVVYQERKRDDQTLQECGCLGREHSLQHCMEKHGEHGEHRINCSTQDVDNEVTDKEATRFILILEKLGDQLQHVAEAGLSRGIMP